MSEAHSSYKHGMGKNRDFEPVKRDAWIIGVKQKANFRCFYNWGKPAKTILPVTIQMLGIGV